MKNVTRAQTLEALDVMPRYQRERLNRKQLTHTLRQLGLKIGDDMARNDLMSLLIREMRKPRESMDTSAVLVTLDAAESNVMQPGQLWTGDNKTVAKHYFAEVKRLTIEQYDIVNQTWMPPRPELYATAARLALDIGGLRNGTTGELLAPESRLTVARDVFKAVNELAQKCSDQYYHEQLLTNLETFKKTAFQGMSSLTLEKKDREAKSLQERKTDVVQVDCTGLIEASRLMLSNLDKAEPKEWVWVSCALAMVTGRRMAEIHESARFELVDDTHVWFYGQLKEKGKTDALAVTGYPIPTLVPAQLVVDGLDWLTRNRKRITNGEGNVNRRYSKDLSVATKSWFSRLTKAFEGNEDRFKYHSFRQLYALVAVRDFCPGDMQDTLFAASILGHDYRDTSTTLRYASDFRLI